MRQRLLTIHVKPPLKRGDCGDGVRVIRRGDDDRIKIALLQQAAKVPVLLRLRKLHGRLGEVVGVHVADGDDVLVLHTGDVASGAACDGDKTNVKFVIRGKLARSGRRAPTECGSGGPESGLLEKLTAVQKSFHGELERDSPEPIQNQPSIASLRLPNPMKPLREPRRAESSGLRRKN